MCWLHQARFYQLSYEGKTQAAAEAGVMSTEYRHEMRLIEDFEDEFGRVISECRRNLGPQNLRECAHVKAVAKARNHSEQIELFACTFVFLWLHADTKQREREREYFHIYTAIRSRHTHNPTHPCVCVASLTSNRASPAVKLVSSQSSWCVLSTVIIPRESDQPTTS